MSDQLPEVPKPKTLVQKLCEVMAAVGYTQKAGWNEAQKYHYVTEADISEKVRPELAKRNIFIFPTVIKNERAKLERTNYDGKTKTSYATDLVMRWTIVDGDTGEERVCEIPGCSESPGDKGVYVAMTGSQKYLLVKSLFLPTGDDPENDANEPNTGSKAAADAVVRDKLQEGTKSKDPKIKAVAEEGLKKLDGAVKSLFYAPTKLTSDPEGDWYVIGGDAGLKTANKDILGKHWNNVAKEILVTGEQLEGLKYQLENRKVPFVLTKGA